MRLQEGDLLSVGTHTSDDPNQRGHSLEALFHLAEFYDYDMRNAKKAGELYKKAIHLITFPSGFDIPDQTDNPYVTVPASVPFVPISKRIQMITSYIYFLLDTVSSYGQADILNLYKNMDLLVVVAGSALEDGFYYEADAPRMKNQLTRGESPTPTAASPTDNLHAAQMIKRTFNAGDLDSSVTLLCENATYLYKIRRENPEYISIYKRMWTLAKRISHMNECILSSYHIFEGRRIGFLDYLAFFYLYR